MVHFIKPADERWLVLVPTISGNEFIGATQLLIGTALSAACPAVDLMRRIAGANDFWNGGNVLQKVVRGRTVRDGYGYAWNSN